MQITDDRIRECAYQIWEAEGKPDGCADKHWEMACKFLQAEAQADTASSDQNLLDDEHHSDNFIPHQNTKKGKHAHHPRHPH